MGVWKPEGLKAQDSGYGSDGRLWAHQPAGAKPELGQEGVITEREGRTRLQGGG